MQNLRILWFTNFLHINCSIGQNSVKCIYYAILQRRKLRLETELSLHTEMYQARLLNLAQSSLGLIPAL